MDSYFEEQKADQIYLQSHKVFSKEDVINVYISNRISKLSPEYPNLRGAEGCIQQPIITSNLEFPVRNKIELKRYLDDVLDAP